MWNNIILLTISLRKNRCEGSKIRWINRKNGMGFASGGGDQAISDFSVFCSFLAAISTFLSQSGQIKYLWNLWDEFYLDVKKLEIALWRHQKIDFSKISKSFEDFFFDRARLFHRSTDLVHLYLKRSALSGASNLWKWIFRFLAIIQLKKTQFF